MYRHWCLPSAANHPSGHMRSTVNEHVLLPAPPSFLRGARREYSVRVTLVRMSLQLLYCASCVAGHAYRGKVDPRALRLTCSSRPRARRSASAAVSACHYAHTGGEHHQHRSNTVVLATVAYLKSSIAVHTGQGGASGL